MRDFLLSTNDKRWNKIVDDIQIPEYLQSETYSDLFKSILSRKLNESTDVQRFLHPDLRDMHSPFLLKDMEKAVKRIQKGILSGEKICIYGDYDVDGITSVSLLLKCFKQLNYPVEFYIPDRHEEGYGLNLNAIQTIRDKGTAILITVDCGIASVKEAKLAQSIGLDMIITDHHECQEEIPPAFAVINPKQANCYYPYHMLAGVGIAYKLAVALLEDLIVPIQDELLELAAFGTIADIAPLTDENRIIAKYGLAALSNTKSPGLSALIACSDLKGKEISAGHVGFMLAPKINAAGRIDDPKIGVVLLTTHDDAQAFEIAGLLKDTNEKRQQMEKDIVDEAIHQLENREDFKMQHISIVEGEGWNSGVIGIVASRLVERFSKPAIVFSIVDGKAKGSARSIDGFDIFEALSQFSHLFEKYGGHEQAAGLTVPLSNYYEFKEQLESHCQTHLPSYLLTPAIKIDADISVTEVNFELIEELNLLEPFGMGNARPIFRLEQAEIKKKTLIGKNKEYTKFEFADGVRTFEAISFDKSGYYDLFKAGDFVDVVCHLDVNEFRGTQTIQFQLKDIRGFRLPLVKRNNAVSQFYFAEARRIALSAKELNKIRSHPIEAISDPIERNTKIWTIDSIEGLYYFYNRIYDQVISDLKIHVNHLQDSLMDFKNHLVLCPVEKWTNEIHENLVHSIEFEYGIQVEETGKILYANWIPDRNHLVSFYKEVKENKYIDNPPMSVEKWLCAMVLSESGLIEVTDNGIEVLPAPKEKIDMEQVPLYRELQSYKNALKKG